MPTGTDPPFLFPNFTGPIFLPSRPRTESGILTNPVVFYWIPHVAISLTTYSCLRVIFRSLWVWFSSVVLFLIWIPLLAVVSLFDRDPARYRTGRWFRRLGAAMTRVNPVWSIVISGDVPEDMRKPYLVIGNHQSLADIPVFSRLPWEMKWVGKASLFKIPILGWMMRTAGDIPVDRGNRRSRAQVLIDARDRLRKRVSVLILPEGTRSSDGRVGAFSDSPFKFAIKEKVSVLPIALDGTFSALPKDTWRFGQKSFIRVRIFEPIDTTTWAGTGTELRDKVRAMIIGQIAEWRGVLETEVDSPIDP